MGNNKIKAIFFDYGGTLDAPGVSWRPRFYSIYKKYGLELPYEHFSKAFFKADDDLVAENPSSLNLSEIVHEQVGRVLKELNLYDIELQRLISKEFLRESFSNINQIIPYLAELKTVYKIGIISNNYGNLQEICKETGLFNLMDIMIDSNQIGAEKPDPKIFYAALDRLNICPEEAVMVGDNIKRDIEGALKVGMKPVLISPDKGLEDYKINKDVKIIREIKELIGDILA